MASLPPQRPASQRRASPLAESSAVTQQPHADRRSSFSAASVDSQTLLLNSPPSQTTKPAESAQAEASAAQPPQPDAEEPRKCWICFNDETEDDEFSSEWRSPCPCVLVAHEKCLLDWIADMEAPNARRRAGGNAGKILCPQCKSEIRLARPRSVVVDAVRSIERLTGMMLLPGFLFVTATAAYTTMYISGVHTVLQIFGPDDAQRILLPDPQPWTIIPSAAARFATHRGRDMWRLALGLPMIPAVLVASRTSAADSFLPFLPLIFFASGGTAQHEMLQLTWPPSAAFTVAALPYVRGIYNAYYERVWLPREQRWLKEIQPRAGTEDENDVPDQDGDLPAGHANHPIILEDEFDDGEEVVEIEVDFDIFADWNNGGAVDNNNAVENPPVPIARGPGPIDAPPLADDENNGNQNQDAAPAPNVPQHPAQVRRQRVRRERNIGFSTTNLADTILGALIFPTIAAAVGQALNQVLPKSWVTPPKYGKPTGFLQTRWGRSILGGCLFVGMKDAVLLYVRWRMAQNHRMRRVLDYDRSKDKKTTARA
ncbi:hypothetical protein K458DRAFT_423177 [Lentithecium fluviatile CBS 122367]|uniref:RING-CH-type domain-containing protein n=1 Tax=Lentithecium fluviatile CBS 122367 TaxID=1168545 RepID=A0A6G1IJR7_9PLEO|nr:hypothetical protein K458DRAFT_423177 [Lentithecium fluviatile CBS 122367]